MIAKVVTRHSLKDDTDYEDLLYWEGVSPVDRWNAVEMLREQFYGKQEHIERVAKMRKLGQTPEEALPIDEFHRKYNLN